MAAKSTGFYGTPVSKGILLVTGTATAVSLIVSPPGKVAASAGSQGTSLIVGGLTVSPHTQWFRQAVHQFVWSTPLELLLGSVLLYHNSRMCERQWGTRKYGTYVSIALALSGLMNVALSLGGIVPRLPTGPYWLVYANMVHYVADVPPLNTVPFAGVYLSDKLINYVIYFQLLGMGPPRAVLVSCSGVLAGALYRWKALGLGDWRMPEAICTALAAVFSPLVHSDPPAMRGNRAVSGPRGAAAGSNTIPAPPQPRSSRPRAHPPAVSEEAVAQLMGMGFTRDAVENALRRTSNNVQRATNLLLDGQ